MKISNKMLATYFANFFDTATMVATGLSLPAWISVLNIDSFTVGLIGALGVNAFGAAIGALFTSFISDKIGRKKSYSLGMILYPVGLAVVILSCNLNLLCAGIFVLGISVGMSVPSSWIYLAEESKKEQRSSNLGFSQIARPAGIITMYILFFVVSNILEGQNEYFTSSIFINGKFFCSKILFMFLFVMSILSIINLKNLPETKAWNSAKNDGHSNFSFAIKLLKNKTTLLSFLFLVLVYAPWNTVAGTLGQFSPSIAALGSVSNSDFALISICTLPFQFISMALFSKLVKTNTYKKLFVIGNIIGLIALGSLLVFCLQINLMNGQLWFFVIIFCAVWNSQSGFSAQCFYSIWSSELFPTQIRGAMQGVMFFVVRSLSGLWLIFAIGFLDVSSVNGAGTIVVLMMLLLIFACILGTICCPKTQNKSLEQIAKERYGKEHS